MGFPIIFSRKGGCGIDEQKQKTIALLKRHPDRFARALGFSALGPMHGAWISGMVFGRGDHTLQAHRGAYKTTCVSVALMLLMLLRPEEKILFLRKTDNDVKEVLLQVQKLLRHPVGKALCRTLYGRELRFTKMTATELSTDLAKGPAGTAQLVGLGIGSSLTGKHFDRIFTDDIVNLQDRISRAEREYTKLVYQELGNIVNRGGRIYNTGTPWHEEDCFTLMPPPEKWDCYSTGLISPEALEKLRRGMLGSLFAANYELRHIAGEERIFSEARRGGDPAALAEGAPIAHVDAAYGGADGTAFTVLAKTPEGYLAYGRLWQRHVSDLTDEIAGLCRRFGVRRVLCETNADKGYLARELRSRGLRTGAYHEKLNKHLKITAFLLPVWERTVFTRDTDEAYLRQIERYAENAAHDDAPDSLACAVRGLRGRAAPAVPDAGCGDAV